MRLQLASDLHLERVDPRLEQELLITPAPAADMLVLAGDVSCGTRGIELFANWPVPVLYVPGNHEFYGLSWEQTREDLRLAARGTSVVLLDNDVADLGRFESWRVTREDQLSKLRFLGTTLWTDYRLQPGVTQSQAMQAAEMFIADHSRIRTQRGAFRAEQALKDHEASRKWLDGELRDPFDRKTVVISHHGPHPLSVHPRWLAPATLALNAAFVSNLTDLLGKADLWLHGHVHDSFSYQVGRCRVLANPRGYLRNPPAVRRGEPAEYENPQFSSHLVVDV
jgi:predicted phosphodiesterase